MTERAGALLDWLVSFPEWLIYLGVGVAAALENVVPPLPSDMVIVIGGVVAGAGGADPRILFLAVWVGNVGSALLVYGVGLRYGTRFFQGPIGNYLLAPAQVVALGNAYRRYGFPIIFFSRFLPVFRPIVPVFAGVAHLGFWRTALPIALASAIWYGLLVYLGSVAGANWTELLARLSTFSGWMWGLAALLIAGVAWWWHRTRRSQWPR